MTALIMVEIDFWIFSKFKIRNSKFFRNFFSIFFDFLSKFSKNGKIFYRIFRKLERFFIEFFEKKSSINMDTLVSFSEYKYKYYCAGELAAQFLP
jgi:hypothetical protein